MTPIDALWHLLGLFLPALATGALAAGAAKALWRTDLKGCRWSRLTRWCASAGSLALLAGLVGFGRDGRLLSYAMMLLATALALWWAGFMRPRG
jgi:hypothetical protein